MNDSSRNNGSSRGGGVSVAMGFVLGAVIGAGIALLLAPRSGAETRRRFDSTGRRWKGTARRKLEGLRETVGEFQRDAESAVQAGRDAFASGQRSSEPHPADRVDHKG